MLLPVNSGQNVPKNILVGSLMEVGSCSNGSAISSDLRAERAFQSFQKLEETLERRSDHLFTIDDVDQVYNTVSQDMISSSIDKLYGASSFAALRHVNAAGGNYMDSCDLFEGQHLKVKILILPKNQRTINMMGNHLNFILVTLYGKVYRKEVSVQECSPNGTASNWQVFLQKWNHSLTEPLHHIEAIPGHQLKVTSKNLIVPNLHPVLINPSSGVTLKAEMDSIVLLFQAIDNPQGSNISFLWSCSPSEPVEMSGPPRFSPKEIDKEAFINQVIQIWQPVSHHLEMESVYRAALEQHLKTKLDDLNGSIHGSGGKTLLPSHSNAVNSIGLILVALMKLGGRFSRMNRLQVVKNDDEIVMWRYVLFDATNVQVRLHLFPSAAETYIHNHKNNFISMSLVGHYHHMNWSIFSDSESDSESDHYFVASRNSDGTLTSRQQKKGFLKPSSLFTHYPGNVFYLNCQTYHTVQVKKGEEEMISLFVRDQGEKAITRILSPSSSSTSTEQVPLVKRSFEIDLEAEEKDKILSRIEEYLKTSFIG